MIRAMRWWDLPHVRQIEVEAFGPDAWSLEQFWAELARVPESRWYVVATADLGSADGFQAATDAPTATSTPASVDPLAAHPASADCTGGVPPPGPGGAESPPPPSHGSDPAGRARGDLIVGYAGLFVAGDAADIQTVAIAAGSRGSGVARALVAALIQRARDLDLRSIHLEVAAGNEAARRLYESAGFTVVGRRRDYYGPGRDAELMTLMLP